MAPTRELVTDEDIDPDDLDWEHSIRDSFEEGVKDCYELSARIVFHCVTGLLEARTPLIFYSNV